RQPRDVSDCLTKIQLFNKMGYYWSLGISFYDKFSAEKCRAEINEVKLSDGRIVKLNSNVYLQSEFEISPHYVLEIYPAEMEVDGRRRNLTYPFFGEIRNSLLDYIRDLQFDFGIAFFEFEGADKVTNENIIGWINEFGLGDILEKESND